MSYAAPSPTPSHRHETVEGGARSHDIYTTKNNPQTADAVTVLGTLSYHIDKTLDKECL